LIRSCSSDCTVKEDITMDTINSTATPATGRSTHPLIIIAAIAVTLFSMAGIAAIMGWVPSSKGTPASSAQLAEAAQAPAVSVPPTTRAPQAPTAVATAKPVHKPAARPAAKPAESHSVVSHNEPLNVASAVPAPPAPVAVAQAAKPVCFDCGTIESIREVQKKGEGSGLGAAAGGVLGGILGHQVGNGRGRDVATVVGAVGGAVACHQVEKAKRSSSSYDVTVRFEDGTTRTLQQTSAPVWRQGDRVRVVNSEIVPNG
jgi:outer membrane lipoprotein SlyB